MSFEVTGANLLFRLSMNGFLIFFLHVTVKAGLSNTFYSSRKKRNKIIEFRSGFFNNFFACRKQ